MILLRVLLEVIDFTFSAYCNIRSLHNSEIRRSRCLELSQVEMRSSMDLVNQGFKIKDRVF